MPQGLCCLKKHEQLLALLIEHGACCLNKKASPFRYSEIKIEL